MKEKTTKQKIRYAILICFIVLFIGIVVFVIYTKYMTVFAPESIEEAYIINEMGAEYSVDLHSEKFRSLLRSFNWILKSQESKMMVCDGSTVEVDETGTEESDVAGENQIMFTLFFKEPQRYAEEISIYAIRYIVSSHTLYLSTSKENMEHKIFGVELLVEDLENKNNRVNKFDEYLATWREE